MQTMFAGRASKILTIRYAQTVSTWTSIEVITTLSKSAKENAIVAVRGVKTCAKIISQQSITIVTCPSLKRNIWLTPHL